MHPRAGLDAFLLQPLRSEKLSQQTCCVLRAQSSDDLDAVVERRGARDVEGRAGCPCALVSAAENEALEPRQKNRPCAHRTGFFRDEKCAFIEPPIPPRFFGLRDGDHLRMRGGVTELFDLIVRARNDFSAVDDHGANGHFILLKGASSLFERLAHKKLVAAPVYGHHCAMMSDAIASGKMNPIEEYCAATKAVAVADLFARGRLSVTGADAARFLQGQFSNDITALEQGQGCYAALCNAKGKMRGDAVVYNLGDAFLLDVEPGQTESTKAGLERFIVADDVLIEDVSSECKHIAVIGPKSKEIVSQITGALLIAPSLRAVTESYDVFGAVEVALQLPRISADTLEILRIEAGIPRYGVDMDENTIPIEAGIETRAISYTKGCYIGQEVIARIRSGGHVNRHLVGLKLDASRIPERGEKIFHEGREAGVVTSACLSPKLGAPLALGFVRREMARAGQKLTLGAANAEIIPLPLRLK